VSDEPEARYEGLGLGLGLAAGATLCWLLPYYLGAGAGWMTAGRVAAWALYTLAASGSLIELEQTSKRRGFSDLGAAAVVVSLGAGLLALGTHLFSGLLAGVFIAVGVFIMVFGLGGAGIGVGRIASGRPRTKSVSNEPEMPSQTPGFTRAEKFAIALAGAQVVLAALALLRS
jgi:hypothetical protein